MEKIFCNHIKSMYFDLARSLNWFNVWGLAHDLVFLCQLMAHFSVNVWDGSQKTRKTLLFWRSRYVTGRKKEAVYADIWSCSWPQATWPTRLSPSIHLTAWLECANDGLHHPLLVVLFVRSKRPTRRGRIKQSQAAGPLTIGVYHPLRYAPFTASSPAAPHPLTGA